MFNLPLGQILFPLNQLLCVLPRPFSFLLDPETARSRVVILQISDFFIISLRLLGPFLFDSCHFFQSHTDQSVILFLLLFDFFALAVDLLRK